MAKYLTQSLYSTEGVKGLVKEGGTARKEAIAKAFATVGGTVESFYFAFGTCDLFMIVDLPDNVSASAASLIANASGASKYTMTVLITPEEMDQAAKVAQEMTPAYRAPGR
jgi:uncharacterized protein with GYD domain